MGLHVETLFLTYRSIQKPSKRTVFNRCFWSPGCKTVKTVNSCPQPRWQFWRSSSQPR